MLSPKPSVQWDYPSIGIDKCVYGTLNGERSYFQTTGGRLAAGAKPALGSPALQALCPGFGKDIPAFGTQRGPCNNALPESEIF